MNKKQEEENEMKSAELSHSTVCVRSPEMHLGLASLTKRNFRDFHKRARSLEKEVYH